MKKFLLASVIASVLAASTAFAFDVPSNQPIKGTEGPGIRYADERPAPPVKGTEGPDVR